MEGTRSMMHLRMRERSLEAEKQAFNSVGWFIPPFISIGYIESVAQSITDKGSSFGQTDLQEFLARVYSGDNLATMVTERYPIVPHVRDYKTIIAEAIEAHFCGLGHVAVAGLLPVVEGAGKKLAEHMQVK